MTKRPAAKKTSVAGARTSRSRSKIARPEIDDGPEPWTIEDPSPPEFPALNFVYRRWAEPVQTAQNLKVYVAGDDASCARQHRACLRRAHVIAWGAPTPTIFEDRTTRFTELEALVRNASRSTIVIFSTIARRAAGDRIEAMKLALAERAVKFVEVPEWYRGFADLPPRPRRSLVYPATKSVPASGSE